MLKLSPAKLNVQCILYFFVYELTNIRSIVIVEIKAFEQIQIIIIIWSLSYSINGNRLAKLMPSSQAPEALIKRYLVEVSQQVWPLA